MMERAAHFQKEKMIEDVSLISRLILDTRQKKKKSNQKPKTAKHLKKNQIKKSNI